MPRPRRSNTNQISSNTNQTDQTNNPTKQFTSSIPAPSKINLSCDIEENWGKFSRQWQHYKKATRLDKEPKDYQCAVFLACIGDEGQEVYEGFAFEGDEDKEDIDVVEAKFKKFCLGATNEVFESYKFHARQQAEGENIDTYVATLRKLAKSCNFKEVDRMIRDRIVIGIIDDRVREKLLEKKTLTLQEALETCRAHEASRIQSKTIATHAEAKVVENSASSVDTVSRGDRKPLASRKGSRYPKRQEQKCYRCGKRPHARKDECPATRVECHRCKKVGHYASVCRSSLHTLEDRYEEEYDSNDYKADMGVVISVDSLSVEPWRIPIEMEGHTQLFKIDTGADVSVIPEKMVPKAKRPVQKTRKRLFAAGGLEIKVTGKFSTKMKYNGKTSVEEVYIVEKLEEALLGRPAIAALKLIEQVNEVNKPVLTTLFEGLGKLQYSEYTIRTKSDCQPYAVSTPRRLALPLKSKVKKELDSLEKLGVIRPVTKPTEWCSPIVVVPKANDKIRLCVDYTRLNEAVKRENFPLPSTDQLLAQLDGAVMFSKLDCNSGFHQIPLAKESQELTTFISPFGRYCYTRLPFGISSGPEIFQRTMCQLLGDQQGVICDMDDILVFGKTKEDHEKSLEEVLTKLKNAGLTLNAEKCEFRKTSIRFLGHIISPKGIAIDPEKVTAITKFPRPTSITELRRLLGMVNHVAKFAGSGLSDRIKPLRDLLKKEADWIWSSPQEEAFEYIKKQLSAAPILAHYSPDKPTCVSCDASSYGLGAVLLQKQQDGEYKPVFYQSRSMTPTEQRYAQVEREALAVTWACEKFSEYITGLKDLKIETDHKPLLALLKTKNLDELTPRIQRFRMRLMRFQYQIEYTRGKNLVTADALSRAPTSQATEEDRRFDEDVHLMVNQVISNAAADQGLKSDQGLERIKKALQEDSSCLQIMSYCKDGWPEICPKDPVLRPFWSARFDISLQDDLLLYRCRLIIPEKLRKNILQDIHTGHQGIVKCRARARESVWWPGISTEVEKMVEKCPTCIKERKVPPEPLITTETPDYPWQKVGIDLFEWKRESYLIVIDYYSRYIELVLLKKTSAAMVIDKLKSIFARHGIPEVVVSDNAQQFAGKEFKSFASRYGFQHRTSSPYYAQANGEAERAVQTAKALLKKADDPYLALLTYRATPLQNGSSPAELLMGRKLRTTVPAVSSNYVPRAEKEDFRKKDGDIKWKQKSHFDRAHRARPAAPLQLGQRVTVKPGGITGTIVRALGHRSYEINTPAGRLRRNRRQLIPCG